MKFSLVFIILVAALLSYCNYSIKQSQDRVKAVDEFTINSALEVREYIESNDQCPKALSGWSKAKNYGDYQLESRHGIMSIFYKCNADLSYKYIVKYSMDSGIYLSGNNDSEIELTYGHFTDHKTLYVGKYPSVKNVVEKIHNY
ncbi:MAG: hypothetical protein V7765_07405 [Oleispira sp.]|jgi:hypothetical protein